MCTYDQLPVPAGQPATLRAAIRNAGTATLSSLIATLNVTGANTATATQTIASLAVGASVLVSFSGVALPNIGSNTVTVAVPATIITPTAAAARRWPSALPCFLTS